MCNLNSFYFLLVFIKFYLRVTGSLLRLLIGGTNFDLTAKTIGSNIITYCIERNRKCIQFHRQDLHSGETKDGIISSEITREIHISLVQTES